MLWTSVFGEPKMSKKSMQCALLFKMGCAIYLRRNFYTLKRPAITCQFGLSAWRVMVVGELTAETILDWILLKREMGSHLTQLT